MLFVYLGNAWEKARELQPDVANLQQEL